MFLDKNLYNNFGRIGTFKLIDLTVIDDDVIKQHKKIAAMEYSMKHISDRDFLLKLNEIIDIIDMCAKRGLGAKLICDTIIYLASGRELADADLIIKRIMNSKLHNYGEDIMTYEESLRHEGEHNAQQKIAVEFLKSGDSVEKVARCTSLPLKEVEKLQKNISH